MKVRCDRNELCERLQAVSGIVPSGSTIKPILHNLLIRATQSGLIIEVTDLEISARVRVDRVEVLEEGIVALPAARLLALVREVPGAAVTLATRSADSWAGDSWVAGSQSGSFGAMLSSDGFNIRLLGPDPQEYPEVRQFQVENALVLQREGFLESLRRVAVGVCRDLSRYQLCGVCFELEKDRLLLTATDGKRLTHDLLRVRNPNEVKSTVIVPNRAVDVACKVLATGDENFQLAFRGPEVQVEFGYGELMAKLVEGTYPDYQLAITPEPKTKVLAKRADLLAAVRSASLVTDRESAAVIFRFSENELCLESQASDVGESRIRVDVRTQGEPVELRFNPVYFIDALRTVSEEEVRLEFAGPGRPGAIRSGQNYRHYLMPVVLE
jgi:DNA polymerase-3 subunit beta